jgi:DUF917 family protein
MNNPEGEIMKYIDIDWVKPLGIGSKLISSGGGGDTENFEKILSNLLEKENLKLLDVSELMEGAYYCSNGMIGTSNIIDSYNFTGREGLETVRRMEHLEECKIEAIYPFEGAGINLLYPLITAATLKLPIVDGDVMGRCFTELQMSTLELNNIGLDPFILKDTMDIMHVFGSRDSKLVDLGVRKVLSRIDKLGFFTCGLEKGGSLKKAIIPGTISFVKNLGEVFFESSNYEDIKKGLNKTVEKSIYGDFIELFKGRVGSITEAERSGIWTSFKLEGYDEYMGSLCNIMTKDQFLLLYRDKEVVCMTPDIITTIDMDTLKPVTVQDVKEGMRLGVGALEAPPQLKTKEALELMGISNFGYKLPYKTVKELGGN